MYLLFIYFSYVCKLKSALAWGNKKLFLDNDVIDDAVNPNAVMGGWPATPLTASTTLTIFRVTKAHHRSVTSGVSSMNVA